MKLWLIERVGYVDYDQFGGFVVRAESEEALQAIVKKHTSRNTWPRNGKFKIDRISEEGEPGIILSDFKAG